MTHTIRQSGSIRVTLGLWFAAALAAVATAQETGVEEFEPLLREQVGEYTILSSTTRSDALPAETAERHNLPQSDEAAILNVTVQREGRNVEADVNVRVTNLAQQIRDIEMRETRANDRVSYLGIIDLAPRETLTIDLEILPAGETEPIRLSYQRSFMPSVP